MLNQIINLVWEWRFVITLGVMAIIYIISEWNVVKVNAYKAMLQAKDLAKNQILNSGEAQENWAVNHIMKLMPMRLKLLLGEQTVRAIVKLLYKDALDYLDDGKLNNSVK